MKKFAFGFLLIFTVSFTKANDCVQFSPSGKMPIINNPKLKLHTQMLCYSEFQVLHSGITHGPLWVAEHLIRSNLKSGNRLLRKDHFYEEKALPVSDRSHLKDYRNSPYDRGHMSPSGDHKTLKGMQESFSLANVVPQERHNNRCQWANIEQKIRKLAYFYNEVFVITGPLFKSRYIGTIGKSHVFIPTHLYKVVYIPNRYMTWVVILNNTAFGNPQYITLREFEKISALSFPGIPDYLKDKRVKSLREI